MSNGTCGRYGDYVATCMIRPGLGGIVRVDYVTMLFPYPGETFAGSDVRELLRRGVDVEVFSLRPRHPESDDLVRQWGIGEAGLDHPTWSDVARATAAVVRAPGLILQAAALALATIGRPAQFVRTLALLPRALAIFQRIERKRPDVVHFFWGHYPSLVARLVQTRLPDVATSVFLGAYDLEWRYPLSGPAARNAHFVWTHSRTNLPALEALGVASDRIRLAYRGLDMSRIPERRTKVDGRIVSVGRLIPSKGTDAVLKAFALLLETVPWATLVVLGDGPERGRLERLADELGVASRLEFRGRVPHEEVLAELARAQVMVFLSRKTSERLPNAVKEAMACGCYCVVSRTPGIDELIPDDGHGRVMESDVPSLVAAAVQEALERPELRERVEARARSRIGAVFDNRITMAAYVSEWGKVSAVPATAASVPRSLPAEGGSTP